MVSTLTHIIDCCRGNDVAVDPIKGRDGTWGLSLVVGNRYFFVPKRDDFDEFVRELLATSEVCCFDLRRIIDWPLGDKVVIDVKSIYGGERNLPQLVTEEQTRKQIWDYRRYLELDQKIVAHAKAAKSTGMDIQLTQTMPKDLVEEWMKVRTNVILRLYTTALASGVQMGNIRNYRERWKFIRSLRQVELNGVRVDQAYIKDALREVSDLSASKALRSMDGLAKDGFVTSLFNPMGSKTGRVRLEGGFNVLGIPHGPARKAIISRFEGGKVYTFDFNAIDYRCIVASVGGELAELYKDAEDFHARTASFLFKEVTKVRRDIMKFISYVYIYGGSIETLMDKTGLDRPVVEAALKKLDESIKPIAEFREHLYMRAQNDGYIDVPGGQRVLTAVDDHPGKVIGLYAQTYSSYVFEQAFTRVQEYLSGKKSCIIFSVHDELVVDVHPEEENEVTPEIKRLMETAIGNYRVNVKKGSNYGQVE